MRKLLPYLSSLSLPLFIYLIIYAKYIVPTTFAQVAGSNYIYPSGNVGIGTSSPITSNGSVGRLLNIETSGATGALNAVLVGSQLTSASPGSPLILEGRVDNVTSGDARVGQIQLVNANSSTTALSGFIVFLTNNSGSLGERMRIDQSGNVGIGTSTPGNDVNMTGGGLTINGAGATQLTVGQNGTLGFALNVNGGQWNMYDKYGGGYHQSLTSQNGNIGIGNSSPNGRLDIQSGNGDGIVLGQQYDNSQTIQTYIDSSISGGGWSTRTTYAGGCCNNLLIEPDVGNVGIGTTSPASKLHLNGIFTLNNGDFGGGSRIQFQNYNNSGPAAAIFGANNGVLYISGSPAYSGQGASDLVVFRNSDRWTDKVTVNTANGTISTTGPIFIGGGESHFQYTSSYTDPNPGVGMGVKIGSGGLGVIGNTISTAPPGCSPCNNLSLATDFGSLPGYSGNTYPTLKTNGACLYFSAGGYYSGYLCNQSGFTNVSSKTIKENYQQLNFQDILNKIDALPVMEWNYKQENPSVKHIGPFAEDFHSAFGLNGSDNKGIALIDSSGVALAGVKGLIQKDKDLETKVVELESKNKELELQIVSLKNQNAQIENRLNILEEKVK